MTGRPSLPFATSQSFLHALFAEKVQSGEDFKLQERKLTLGSRQLLVSPAGSSSRAVSRV
jgi:hypothetical protein